MKIIPAILTEDKVDFNNKLAQSEKFTDFAQIDIMDGKFVPSKSVGLDVLSSIKTHLGIEFHLMVEDPLKYLDAAQKSKVKRVIFHYEIKDVEPGKIIKEIRALGLEAGLAINPETGLSEVRHLFNLIDVLLLLSVNPGYYGSPFIPGVLEKAKELSQDKHNFIIALDGGVKLDNILEIKNSGVELACVGSSIFKGSALENYRALNKKISEN
ncbi:MAG: ribulose-phosphate 3-epimerase [Candidatus Omnitrophota bacterium]